MRTDILTVITLFFFSVLFWSCNKTSTKKEERPDIIGKVTNQTGCADRVKTSDNLIADSNQSCIIYTFNAENEKLSILHENAGFNCCPGEINCRISFSNDTIVVEELEEYPMCDCNCLFNLEIEINGVLPSKYYLKFIEPYAGDQLKLEFEIDLLNHPSAEYCVERNMYPWGL